MKYQKKPVVIEAFQLGVDPMPKWFADAVATGRADVFKDGDEISANIETLEGWHYASPKDFIIRGVKGEIYPCKPDIFAMTYEKVGES